MKKILGTILMSVSMCITGNAQSYDHSHDGHVHAKGMAAMDANAQFVPYEFVRHAVGDNDILIEIMYSGICHSDIHQVKEHWGPASFPMVPGHEIAGRVTQVGKNVTKFKVGDYAGVGCMVNSCGICDHCMKGEEQYCDNGKTVYTYNSTDFFHDNTQTKGGYANNIVVSEHFGIKIPEDAPLDKIAPLLCAGITTYSPLRFTNVKAGDKVAVAGFGGLGHMAVQYAVSFGADVTVFDITEEKRKAAEDMGAVRYVNVTDPTQLSGLENSFHVILSTIPYSYDMEMYIPMLKVDGELVQAGMPHNGEYPVINTQLLGGRRKVYGTLIGGIRETQEMIDYSVAKGIYPGIEIINPDQINEAWNKVEAGEVQFRYVIDMSKL
ncbi:MAG: NAD(P)-dependent alcohol dehydrogenase [Tannerellaceae bacterium]|nr:NAD(P)-dependent alcohol dehydrogenase [Tannerellaceae bacterium]